MNISEEQCIDLRDHKKELFTYINKTPELINLLYDIELMPEQVIYNKRDLYRTLRIAFAWRAYAKMTEDN